MLLSLKRLTVMDVLLPKVRELKISNSRTTQAARELEREEQNMCQKTFRN